MDLLEPLRLTRASDNDVFAAAAVLVATPVRDPANSFCLHAPLELLARRTLLGFVAPDGRDAVRERMLCVAATYEQMAAPAAPVAPRDYASTADASAALLAAVDRAELDDVDAAADWLVDHGTDDTIAALAPAVVDRLAAAGHACIYFSLLPRGGSGPSARALFRPLVHELAPRTRVAGRMGARRRDHQRGRWRRARGRARGDPAVGPARQRLHLPDRAPGRRRCRARRRGPDPARDVDDAARAMLRVAALSMLHDDPASAPYGWTHCLTLPLAVLAVTPQLPDPAVGLAIAATYVAGFRAALGAHAIDLHHEPEPVAADALEALDAEPAIAAAAVTHAPDTRISGIVAELAARGGAHEDAHVAKYTLACFDAAGRDRECRRLYLAAAAYLQSWWLHAAPPTA